MHQTYETCYGGDYGPNTGGYPTTIDSISHYIERPNTYISIINPTMRRTRYFPKIPSQIPFLVHQARIDPCARNGRINGISQTHISSRCKCSKAEARMPYRNAIYRFLMHPNRSTSHLFMRPRPKTKCKIQNGNLIRSSSDHDVFEELSCCSVSAAVVTEASVVELLLATSSSILGTNSGMRNGFETTSS
jgi:hypothetical protein